MAITKDRARAILRELGLTAQPDFHGLPSHDVGALLSMATQERYRAPKDANGNKVRSFYAFLCRRAGDPKTQPGARWSFVPAASSLSLSYGTPSAGAGLRRRETRHAMQRRRVEGTAPISARRADT